ncbi:hypothetical protein tinsulaeT_05180 [Thalassotalea insulae]|uniref:Peptidyl-prolyl cis-trans isomerase n=1 Tax=Thalassotalea insulae TaxID=2056778 RepID=A0ABQ6GMF8_9GAMM|nr:peptidylprolyl isomerase [Thalassotalea insulae]GLX77178.1 hypothetical protein tinsulaeT_05180 [Thalassotalea insulae]
MKKLLSPLLLAAAFNSTNALATIVEFQTSHGNFKVNLHDETTPKTVNNFLNYLNAGKYNNSIIHRTVDDFVIQGGGAKFEGTLPPTWLETENPIDNEPVYSNVAATISMAKQSGKINSATSQWFINTKNNASVLDPVDPYGGGAYAVFGEVIEDGMDVVNAIAEIPRCNTGYDGFKELPMPDYQDQCGDASAVPGQENFVTIYQVVIYDNTTKTDDNLSSIKNTLYKTSVDKADNNSSSGGSITWLALILLALPFCRKK